MRRAPVLLALLLAPVLAAAQGTPFYLGQRRVHKVDRPMPVERWATLPDGKVAELRAEVQGIARTEGATTLLLARPGGDPLAIECPGVPDWLDAGQMARVLVRVRREAGSAPAYVFIAAAPDEEIAPLDPRPVPVRKAVPPPAATGRDIVISGPSRPPLSGPIGGSRKGRRSRVRSAPTLSRSVGTTPISRAYAAFIKRQNPRLSDRETTRIALSVVGFSLKYGVDARLIVAMVIVESNFNPMAVSRSGARGLGQLMPGTARDLGVRNAHDSVDNLDGMVRLMRSHLVRYKASTGDDLRALQLALAAYNAGPGAVSRHGGIPPYRETQNYVRKIVALYRQLTS